MKKIISATLLKGVNIKLKKGILFGGQPIPLNLIDEMRSEIEEHPNRWAIVYEEDANLESALDELDAISGETNTADAGVKTSDNEMPQELKLTKKRKYNKSKKD